MKLAGIKEIAELEGVSVQRAHQLASRPDFPQKLDRIAAGPVWDMAEVRKWSARRQKVLSHAAEKPEREKPRMAYNDYTLGDWPGWPE